MKHLTWKMIAAGAAALVCLAVLAGVIISQHQPLPQPLQPGQKLIDASQGLDEITIDASFAPDESKLSATQTLRLRNREGEPLNSLVLRTYANAFAAIETSPAATEEMFDSCYPEGFSPGSISISKLAVNDTEQTVSFTDEAQTVLSVDLPEGWQPEEWITLTLEYQLLIPEARYRFGHSGNIWMLGNVFPQMAVYENGQWRQEPYFSIGDPFVSECANYTVTLRLPEGYQPAATGYAKGEGGCYRYEAPAVRDFGLVLVKNGVTRTAREGGTLLNAVAENASDAQRMLKFAQQALICYNKFYGIYPYASLTAATVDFPFGGMEYPGLVMVGREVLAADGDSLEITVAHEVAHQWWYAVVGSDQYYEAWQDEALCEYALLDYVSQYYSEAAREDLAFKRFETAMRVTVPKGVTPGSPIDYFGDLPEYTLVTYRRGAALMVALETALSREGFNEVLRTYYADNAFGLADRRAFGNALKKVSGSDWAALLEDYLDTYIAN